MLRRVLSFLVVTSIIVAVGCTSSEKQRSAQSATEAMDYRNTLVTRLPNNVVGFIHFDSKSPAYKKLDQSPWASGKEIFDVSSITDKKLRTVIDGLAAAGLDLSKPDVWDKFVTEVVAFGTDQGRSTTNQGVGFAFRS